jgi:hypothetical protein
MVNVPFWSSYFIKKTKTKQNRSYHPAATTIKGHMTLAVPISLLVF